jgi:hypothetical protein
MGRIAVELMLRDPIDADEGVLLSVAAASWISCRSAIVVASATAGESR